MRLPIIATIVLSSLAFSFEPPTAEAQLFPGIGRRCLRGQHCFGPGVPPRMMRRMGHRCLANHCLSPQVCPPVPCAPVCPVYTTRMHPRRVVDWEMIPRTVCRRETYCETVPVTTYRQVVITVPQTEYRNVMRQQLVPQQVMVPRRRVSTVWEPRLHRSLMPVSPPPCSQPMPVYTNACCTSMSHNTVHSGGPAFGMNPFPSTHPHPLPYSSPFPQTTPFPHSTQLPPSAPFSGHHELAPMPAPAPGGSSVPQPPMVTPPGHRFVPAPMEEPQFRPTTPNDQSWMFPGFGNSSLSQYSPWQPIPSRHNDSWDHTPGQPQFRTLPPTPGLADATPKFVPAPSASTVWQYRR